MVSRRTRTAAVLAVVLTSAALLVACTGGSSPQTGGQTPVASPTRPPNADPDCTTQDDATADDPTHIYWVNAGIQKGEGLEAEAHSIGVANIDGTGVNQELITGITFPSGIAVHGDYVYWSDVETNTIGRAKTDGTEVDYEFITEGVYFAVGLVARGGCLYWSNNGTQSINRANLDGTEVDQDFILLTSGVQMPNGLASRGDSIYWTNVANSIGVADLDGGNANGAFVNNVGAQDFDILSPLPVGLAVDEQYIYWPNMQDDSIGRVLRDGTGIEKRFIEGADFPTGLATDDTYLYWANNDGTIGRSKVDGTEVDQDFITGADGPAGIAVG